MNLFRAFLLLILGTTLTFAQSPTIRYNLSMSQPWTHLYEVQITFDRLPAGDATVDLVLPVWRTGRYIIFDFAGSVQEFQSLDAGGNRLGWEKSDKSTWRVRKGKSRTVQVQYTVYANEFDLRTKGLNDEYGFLDGITAFMYIEKYRYIPVTLVVTPYSTWHVTTGLDAVPGKPNHFTASNYDHLADSPLFIGNQKDYEFEVGEKKHVLSILGEGNYKSQDLIDDIAKIVQAHLDFWGSLPYNRYVFMLHLSSLGGGGTEHINSTIMGTRPFVFSNPNQYRGFLGLVAHEYFHTWNVKQIRPRAISPYHYSKENYIKELWIAEGTTSYYGPIMLLKAGFVSADRLIEGLGRQIMGDRTRPGNAIQSATESSFDAWIKFWKPTPHSYNAESDYYDKGSDISLLLDLEIRHRSANKHSLDDVMRELYRRFPWNGTGYTVDDFQKIAERFAGSSLNEFFASFVHGTAPLEWERGLSYVGLDVHAKLDSGQAYLGIHMADRGDRTLLTRVVAGSPAHQAGLNADDELVALNGYRVRSQDVTARLADFKPGGVVTITVFRDDRLREFRVTLSTPPVPSYTVSKSKTATPLQKSIFESWTGSKFNNQ
ncbi:MAG: M61 family metallopeptidase [Ignavibacteria bacterium]|nr:M61 family metallopeptidase [Ignavibacteria bacterium]